MKKLVEQLDWSLHTVVTPAIYDAVTYVRSPGLLEDIKQAEQRMADTLQQKRLVLLLANDTVLDWWLIVGDPDSVHNMRVQR